MKTIGVIGWKNSGKTTLVSKLVNYFSSLNLKVGVIKHAHHSFDIDHPNTDSYKIRKSGAFKTTIVSNKRLAVIEERADDNEIDFANNTSSGLAAYVFTTNLSKALQSAKKINAGSICINEPHYSVQLPHGGLKQSGVGKDCSRYSIEEYLTLKRVSILMEDK